MSRFANTETKAVSIGDSIIFENNTDSDFSVAAGIIFRESGVYDVSITGDKITVSKLSSSSVYDDGFEISDGSYNHITKQEAIDALQKCHKFCIDCFDSYHIDIGEAEFRINQIKGG